MEFVTETEQRTIKCVLMLDEGEPQLFLLTPSQYSLLMYISNEEMDFYNSQVIPLEENPFKTF